MVLHSAEEQLSHDVLFGFPTSIYLAEQKSFQSKGAEIAEVEVTQVRCTDSENELALLGRK